MKDWIFKPQLNVVDIIIIWLPTLALETFGIFSFFVFLGALVPLLAISSIIQDKLWKVEKINE